MDDLPEITILTPTYKRHKFLPLWLNNIKNQSYPHEKIKVILDECRSNEPFIDDIEAVRKFLHPIKIDYRVHNSRSTIGMKRNRLVKNCKTKYFQFMDTDDLYEPNCCLYNYCLLKEKNVKCVGSDKMLFCYTKDNYKVCGIDCGNRISLIHEATIFAERKWFNTSNKFLKKSTGEGKRLFEGMSEKQVAISQIENVMLCLVHSDNTIDKDRFKVEDGKMKYPDEKVIEYLKELKIT